jgi:hypothetical protein
MGDEAFRRAISARGRRLDVMAIIRQYHYMDESGPRNP